MGALYTILSDIEEAVNFALPGIATDIREADILFQCDPEQLIVISLAQANPIQSGNQPKGGGRKALVLVSGKKTTQQMYGIEVAVSIYQKRATPPTRLGQRIFDDFEDLWDKLHSRLWSKYVSPGLEIEPNLVFDPQAYQLNYAKFSLVIRLERGFAFHVEG